MANNLLEFAINLPFVDEQYALYRRDPESVDPSWRRLFENGAPATHGGNGRGQEVSGARAGVRGSVGAALAEAAAAHPAPIETTPISALSSDQARYARVYALVNSYRVRGHLEAKLDPLDHVPIDHHPDLDSRTWGFTDADLQRPVPSGGFFGVADLPLAELLERLRATYCGHLGVEMMHITETERRAWLQQRMEPTLNQATLDRDTQLYILDRLVAAETFERFVHTKYVGTKRFSLEGSETLIPLLDLVLERAGIQGVEEVVIGMAHRGRLNVLVNIMGKRAAEVFSEFEDVDPEKMFGGGDVKYHLGFSSDRTTRAGHQQHLTLAFNPSHLEAVDPVVVGRVRAKQRRRGDTKRERVLGILIHGDAAFAGQGLVAETLNLSQLRGYRTGGTVHVIVNNQIGFTTAPQNSRSSIYCTDIAKAIQVPIFHVNGDDPEAVGQAVRLAMDYRRAFQSDVVIDMFCFRKYGHNEGDEPAFTQPLLYQAIERHPTVREIYGRSLEERGLLTSAEADAIVSRRNEHLNAEFSHGRARSPNLALQGYWRGYAGGADLLPDVDTAVPRERLTALTERLTSLPEGFRAHPKIARLLLQRGKMGRGEEPIDWGMGEALAFASLVNEGAMVRLSGQDTRRGTFSHRHSVIVEQRTEQEYLPLENIREGQGVFRVYDSPLSEAAVLGFEFGYSLDYPDGLVCWEAQFGDFVNGAQVIIDQFITSSEDKWKRLSGLTLLLPHGFEGQGPEHSSARFERFLEACAEDNLQVCYPSTPAQYFHLLRRQVLRKWRKPLICITPKSLLRLPAARSPADDFATGGFRRILDDPDAPDRAQVTRILLCTGKIFYELAEERTKRGDQTVAILRLEQLYPLHANELASALDSYDQADEVVWVQEEPTNMGARNFIYERLLHLAGHRRVETVTRDESASPATGSHKAHVIEQAEIIDRAFAPIDQID